MEPPLKRQRIAGPQEQLHAQRARNDLRLKSRFEHIFEKFSKEFTGVGDEIDLHTGKIIVNNGHLITMQNERDIEGLANDEDELAADTVGPLREPEVDKSDLSPDLQGSLATTVEAVKEILPLPMEVPCVGLNIASAIKMDDGTTYDTNVHGDLFINRTILNQLSRLGPHIRKSIANVKRSAATSVVVSIETEDLTVDPKWRVPVVLQQTPDEEVENAVGSSEVVEADSKIPECDPERSPSPEGVSLWALDNMPSSRKGLSRKDAAPNAPRPKDQAPKNSKPKISKPGNPKAKGPKPGESKIKESSPKDLRPAHLMPEAPKIKDTNSKQTPMVSMPQDPGPKDPKQDESRHADPGSKDKASQSSWTTDKENILRNQRTEYGLTVEQVRIPGRYTRSIAQRCNDMLLNELTGTPPPFPNADDPGRKDSEADVSIPSMPNHCVRTGTSKQAHLSDINGQMKEVLAEDTTIKPRDRSRRHNQKIKERLSIPDTREMKPVEPIEVAVDRDTGSVPDNLDTDANIAPRNRKRGLDKKTRERLSMAATNAGEQEPTELAVGGNSGVSAESQAPGSCEAGNASHNVPAPSLAQKSRKRGRPSLARGLEGAHDTPASHHIDMAVIDQLTSEKTLSVEVPKQSIKLPKPRKRRATEKLTVPGRPRILSETPELLRNNSPAPVALEKEPEPVAQASSLQKARAPVRSIVADLPPRVHDAAKKNFRKPANPQGRSSTPPPLNQSSTSQKFTMSSVMISTDLTTPYPVSPSTPDNIVSSVEVDSSVNTRVPVGGGSAKRRHATWSIPSSPDPVASLSKKAKNVTQASPSRLSSRKTTAQQHARKPTRKKKRQAMSASFAPPVSLSSIVGDASDDEISNINAKDNILNPTKSPGSAIKSRPCGSPGYSCKRSLCLTCN